MMRLCMIAITSSVLTLTACAAPANPEATLPQENALPAPAASADAVRVTADDAGKTIALKVGQQISVALVGVPTAGYVWAVAKKPDFLSAPTEGGGPTSKQQLQPGFTGGNHWEVLTFTAERAGAADLTLEQRRPWETSEPPSATFSITVRVAP